MSLAVNTDSESIKTMNATTYRYNMYVRYAEE